MFGRVAHSDGSLQVLKDLLVRYRFGGSSNDCLSEEKTGSSFKSQDAVRALLIFSVRLEGSITGFLIYLSINSVVSWQLFVRQIRFLRPFFFSLMACRAQTLFVWRISLKLTHALFISERIIFFVRFNIRAIRFALK